MKFLSLFELKNIIPIISLLFISCTCPQSKVYTHRAEAEAWRKQLTPEIWKLGSIVSIDYSSVNVSNLGNPFTYGAESLSRIQRMTKSPETSVSFVGLVVNSDTRCYSEPLLFSSAEERSLPEAENIIRALNRSSTGLVYNEFSDYRWLTMRSRVRLALRSKAASENPDVVGVIRSLTVGTIKGSTEKIIVSATITEIAFAGLADNIDQVEFTPSRELTLDFVK